ncbi:ABC transporter substrate-binding protein [Denitromonas sp.]|uniref:ABC transporter substrate-binding protein n=1 Tax=Denitromonas sp. TaxID=2734609 RepID=UPI002AFDDE52|nr:ABC transporter substrate-binding protein [Denitromonas sp.]
MMPLRLLAALRRMLYLCLLAGPALAASPTGWPTPYTQVSGTSVDWLKAKGWWPLTVAWQPAFAGQNATVVALKANALLSRRGLDARFVPMASGVAVNAAISDGSAQLGAGGNFPLTQLVDQGAPIRVIAITAPNLKHQVIVPTASPIQSLSDFKGMQPPATIGLVLGSSAEFYFQAAAATHGLKLGRDVVLKNVSQDEQRRLPAELAAVVPWDPTATQITTDLKSGRAIDVSYPYNVYQGSFFVREALVRDVPDVALAITEALVEAELWLRLNPALAADVMAEQPELRHFSRPLLAQQLAEYNLLYKLSYLYPLGAFWGRQNTDIAMWLFVQGKLGKPLQGADYAARFADGPMTQVFDRLGWKIPARPPYIPADFWMNFVGNTLPAYDTYLTMKGPQAWPEPGDLTKPFSFAGKVHTP